MNQSSSQTSASAMDIIFAEGQRLFGDLSGFIDPSLAADTLFFGKAILLLLILVVMLIVAGSLIFG